jgi:hypothetical protein
MGKSNIFHLLFIYQEIKYVQKRKQQSISIKIRDKSSNALYLLLEIKFYSHKNGCIEFFSKRQTQGLKNKQRRLGSQGKKFICMGTPLFSLQDSSFSYSDLQS